MQLKLRVSTIVLASLATVSTCFGAPQIRSASEEEIVQRLLGCWQHEYGPAGQVEEFCFREGGPDKDPWELGPVVSTAGERVGGWNVGSEKLTLFGFGGSLSQWNGVHCDAVIQPSNIPILYLLNCLGVSDHTSGPVDDMTFVRSSD